MDQNGRTGIVEGRAVRVAADLVESGRSGIVIRSGGRPSEFDFVGGVDDALHAQIRNPSGRINIVILTGSVDRDEAGTADDPPEGLNRNGLLVGHGTSATSCYSGGRRRFLERIKFPDWDGSPSRVVRHLNGHGVVSRFIDGPCKVDRVNSIRPGNIRI